jgi:hypothetical protein
MVNIKIMCGCGQRYSFDVYPFEGRMPAPVQCPICGMDGTAAANEILARTLSPPPPPPAPAPLRIAPQPASAVIPNPPAAPLRVLPHPVSGGIPNLPPPPPAPPPDVVKDVWNWCQNLVAGWRKEGLPAAAGAAGEPMTIAENIWRRRALEAEWRAQEAVAAARADLAPHLAQALKEALVQELAIQRKELLSAQQIAVAEIAQLSQHLDELKAPMQERLRSYETRIQDLEKELTARSEENRLLLQLKIEMVRHQLEIERTRPRVAFN